MSNAPPLHFTHSTLPYWQAILPSNQTQAPSTPPFQYAYPAPLPTEKLPSPSSSVLLLPIRPLLSNPNHAVASLLVNQASFDVVDCLAGLLAQRLKEWFLESGFMLPEADWKGSSDDYVVVGLPSLGNTLAPIVARALGFARYIALGYSQKFWYTPSLSVAASSITSPSSSTGSSKRIYLDPYLLPLIHGKRVIIIDDAVSSGTTVKAVWEMLEGSEVKAEVVVCGVVMTQGGRWRSVLGEEEGGRAEKVVGVLESPLLEKADGGWVLRN